MLQRILVIDDEQDFLDSLSRGLFLCGFKHVITEKNPECAANLLKQGQYFDIALIDITMPEMTGIELLEFIKKDSPATECIMVTASDEASIAVNCMKKGAFDYLVKPLNMEELLVVILKALERKNLLEIQLLGKRNHLALSNPSAFSSIITGSEHMQRLLREAELHAASKVPILITGETGTGKELLARAIHSASSRAHKTFTPINMSSLTGSLFDAEFYGHTKGAFTGAVKDRKGYLENTSGGTLFLDEIGSLPLELQGKLLRVIQEGEYFKLGTSRPQGVDVRFIAATNAELETLQEQGLFRKDLFYRLCGAWLNLPPLRERNNDVPLLVDHFLRDYRFNERSATLDDSAWEMLLEYDYPGNIRELKSIVHHAANLAQGRTITVDDLPSFITKSMATRMSRMVAASSKIIPLAAIEKEYILRIYQYTGNNKLKTARMLGIGINTLRRKLHMYDIS